jgi:hypothetical protein
MRRASRATIACLIAFALGSSHAAIADIPPSPEWTAKWKEITYGFRVKGLERAAPGYMLITTSCGRRHVQDYDVFEFTADMVGSCDDLYSIKRDDYETWRSMSYNPRHPQADDMIFLLHRGPLVHHCDSQAHPVDALPRGDPRNEIEETLDVVKIDESGCVLRSNAPAGGWADDASTESSTHGHGCAACAVPTCSPSYAVTAFASMAGLALAAAWRFSRRRR